MKDTKKSISDYKKAIKDSKYDVAVREFLFDGEKDMDVWYYQGKIHAVTFTNMVMFGLKLKQYDWVENFIQNYQHILIGTTVPEATVSFNRAINSAAS